MGGVGCRGVKGQAITSVGQERQILSGLGCHEAKLLLLTVLVSARLWLYTVKDTGSGPQTFTSLLRKTKRTLPRLQPTTPVLQVSSQLARVQFMPLGSQRPQALEASSSLVLAGNTFLESQGSLQPANLNAGPHFLQASQSSWASPAVIWGDHVQVP